MPKQFDREIPRNPLNSTSCWKGQQSHIARAVKMIGRHEGLDLFWNLPPQATWMSLWDHTSDNSTYLPRFQLKGHLLWKAFPDGSTLSWPTHDHLWHYPEQQFHSSSIILFLHLLLGLHSPLGYDYHLRWLWSRWKELRAGWVAGGQAGAPVFQ